MLSLEAADAGLLVEKVARARDKVGSHCGGGGERRGEGEQREGTAVTISGVPCPS